MRVLITGGAGLIGSAIARHLLEQGYDVHLTDLIPDPKRVHASYTQGDIMNFAAVRDLIRGCDAVVHMAALRSPLNGPGQDVYSVNTVGTFNIFEAAAHEGVRRVVQASSINAIGCAWSIGDFAPQYLPMDEEHPRVTNDPYSFSKQQVEDIGDYFWRREGISSAAFRFPAVYESGYRQSTEVVEGRRKMREFLDSFVALPEAEQARQLGIAREVTLAYRAARSMEYPNTTITPPTVEGLDDRLLVAYALDRFNLWSDIDERDAALAVEKALSADFEGSHPLFVCDRDNWLGYDSRTLARVFFPQVALHEITGSESLVSIRRARELIGFKPQHTLYSTSSAQRG